MWWRGEHRVALLFGAALIPLMWFGGDWLGSGNAATAANRALQPVPGSAGVSPHPARAVVSEAINMLPLAGWIAFVLALIATIRAPARHLAVFWLATWAAAWTVIVAVMAERGYAGLPRFLFMATGLEAVVAGVGCALLADAIANAVQPRHLRVA